MPTTHEPASAEVQRAILQRFVDRYPDDVIAIQTALVEEQTPEPARRILVAALRYVVERFDLYPDHLRGMGVIDDAAVLRLAAKHAVSYGCEDPGVRRLGAEAVDLWPLFEDLLAPFEELVNRLPSRRVDGKNAADVVANAEARMELFRELGHGVKAFKAAPRDLPEDADAAIKEMRRMVRHGLVKEGLIR